MSAFVTARHDDGGGGLVSGVPVGDIPCYPKHEAVIPQHLPYVSAAMAGRTTRRTDRGREEGREAGLRITAGTLITSASPSVISVNLQLIRNCRHRREERVVYIVYRGGPMRTGARSPVMNEPRLRSH